MSYIGSHVRSSNTISTPIWEDISLALIHVLLHIYIYLDMFHSFSNTTFQVYEYQIILLIYSPVVQVIIRSGYTTTITYKVRIFMKKHKTWGINSIGQKWCHMDIPSAL